MSSNNSGEPPENPSDHHSHQLETESAVVASSIETGKKKEFEFNPESKERLQNHSTSVYFESTGQQDQFAPQQTPQNNDYYQQPGQYYQQPWIPQQSNPGPPNEMPNNLFQNFAHPSPQEMYYSADAQYQTFNAHPMGTPFQSQQVFYPPNQNVHGYQQVAPYPQMAPDTFSYQPLPQQFVQQNTGLAPPQTYQNVPNLLPNHGYAGFGPSHSSRSGFKFPFRKQNRQRNTKGNCCKHNKTNKSPNDQKMSSHQSTLFRPLSSGSARNISPPQMTTSGYNSYPDHGRRSMGSEPNKHDMIQPTIPELVWNGANFILFMMKEHAIPLDSLPLAIMISNGSAAMPSEVIAQNTTSSSAENVTIVNQTETSARPSVVPPEARIEEAASKDILTTTINHKNPNNVEKSSTATAAHEKIEEEFPVFSNKKAERTVALTYATAVKSSKGTVYSKEICHTVPKDSVPTIANNRKTKSVAANTYPTAAPLKKDTLYKNKPTTTWSVVPPKNGNSLAGISKALGSGNKKKPIPQFPSRLKQSKQTVSSGSTNVASPNKYELSEEKTIAGSEISLPLPSLKSPENGSSFNENDADGEKRPELLELTEPEKVIVLPITTDAPKQSQKKAICKDSLVRLERRRRQESRAQALAEDTLQVASSSRALKSPELVEVAKTEEAHTCKVNAVETTDVSNSHDVILSADSVNKNIEEIGSKSSEEQKEIPSLSGSDKIESEISKVVVDKKSSKKNKKKTSGKHKQKRKTQHKSALVTDSSGNQKQCEDSTVSTMKDATNDAVCVQNDNNERQDNQSTPVPIASDTTEEVRIDEKDLKLSDDSYLPEMNIPRVIEDRASHMLTKEEMKMKQYLCFVNARQFEATISHDENFDKMMFQTDAYNIFIMMLQCNQRPMRACESEGPLILKSDETGLLSTILYRWTEIPLFDWCFDEVTAKCAKFVMERINYYEKLDDRHSKNMRLLYLCVKQKYNQFSEDITYIVSRNLTGKSLRKLEANYLKMIEKCVVWQTTNRFGIHPPTIFDLPERMRSIVGERHSSRFSKYVEKQYIHRFQSTGPGKLELFLESCTKKEKMMFNAFKDDSLFMHTWCNKQTREFFEKMLGAIKRMEDTTKTIIYAKFYDFLLKIDSIVISCDVSIITSKLKIKPGSDSLNHHSFILELWFGELESRCAE